MIFFFSAKTKLHCNRNCEIQETQVFFLCDNFYFFCVVYARINVYSELYSAYSVCIEVFSGGRVS